MPYKTNADLPKTVINVLPLHGQDIYREAFNHAWEEYKDPEKRKTQESREEVSHIVAWAAVKRRYHKVGEKWEEKP